MDLAPNQLYMCPTLPDHWIGTDALGAPWMFLTASGGWHSRAPYRGHCAALRLIDPHYAIGTGWPCADPRHRTCYGCGRTIDPHAGLSVVFCGRCGDDR